MLQGLTMDQTGIIICVSTEKLRVTVVINKIRADHPKTGGGKRVGQSGAQEEKSNILGEAKKNSDLKAQHNEITFKKKISIQATQNPSKSIHGCY